MVAWEVNAVKGVTVMFRKTGDGVNLHETYRLK